MPVSAPELAAQLGIDAKNLRKWLRVSYGHSETQRWELNDRQVEEVKRALQHGHISTVLSTDQGKRVSAGLPQGLPGYAYRVFPRLYLEAASRYKTSPEVLRLEVGGTTVNFYPILHLVRTNSRGRRPSNQIALAGNGDFISTSGRHEGFVTVDNGDYLDTDYYYYPHQRQHDDRKEYSFYHRDYVSELQKVKVLPHLIGAVLPDTAGKLDTPQYLVMNWYNQQFSKVLFIKDLFVESIKSGKLVDEFTLSDLWSRIPIEKPSYGYRHRGGFYMDNDTRSSLRPITSYLSTINLLNIIPPEGPEFQTKLKDIYHRFAFVPDQRALWLREEVAQRYGFKKTSEGGWIKDDVEIKPDLGIYIGRSYTCVVSAITVDLPFEDEVVRRMLCVATKYREKISTIGPTKRAILERVFSDGGDQPD